MPTKTSSDKKSVRVARPKSDGRTAEQVTGGASSMDSAAPTEDHAMEGATVTIDTRVDASAAADHAGATGVAGPERSGKARSGGSKLSDEQIEYFQSLLLAERARLEEER